MLTSSARADSDRTVMFQQQRGKRMEGAELQGKPEQT